MIKMFSNLTKLGQFQQAKGFLNTMQASYQFSNEKMVQFTEVFDKKAAEDKNIKLSSGRAWRAAELRLKNSEDLHKLWYVLLKEKNTIVSDNQLKKKIHGSRGPQGRMTKIKVSMARLLTVVNERKKIRENYRKHLEDNYVREQRQIYEAELREQEKNQIIQPEVTHQLLRAKYRDLKQGIDNTNYIQQAVDKIQKKQALKQELAEKYDYKGKQIVEQEEFSDSQTQIPRFSSLFERQISEGRAKISEEEVLRAHVKNWKMLNLRQRRIIINFLQARRAKEAKKEFLKELDLLSQKIAYDSMQERVQA